MPNLAKRSLIAIGVDTSPSTEFKMGLGSKTAMELINLKLNSLITQLCAIGKIRSSAEVCFVTYSSDIEVKPFVPLKTLENNVPEFTAVKKGGTRTASAVDAAYNAIHKRAEEIVSKNGSLYTSVFILLTDGDVSVHDSDDVIRKVTEKVNECTFKESRAEKILPLIIGLGDNIADESKKMLAGFSKGVVDKGFFQIHNSTDSKVDEDMTEVFNFLFQSIIKSISTDSVDFLLDEVRSMVEEVYGETICRIG